MVQPSEYLAPDGTIWVCGACGKSGKERDRIGDEACFLNAVLCWDDKCCINAAVPPDKLKEFGLTDQGWRV